MNNQQQKTSNQPTLAAKIITLVGLVVILISFFPRLQAAIVYLKGPSDFSTVEEDVKSKQSEDYFKNSFVQLEIDNLYGPFSDDEETVKSYSKGGRTTTYKIKVNSYLYKIPDKEEVLVIRVHERDFNKMNELVEKTKSGNIEKTIIKGRIDEVSDSEKIWAPTEVSKLLQKTIDIETMEVNEEDFIKFFMDAGYDVTKASEEDRQLCLQTYKEYRLNPLDKQELADRVMYPNALVLNFVGGEVAEFNLLAIPIYIFVIGILIWILKPSKKNEQ